jgi:hypothetical protein
MFLPPEKNIFDRFWIRSEITVKLTTLIIGIGCRSGEKSVEHIFSFLS